MGRPFGKRWCFRTSCTPPSVGVASTWASSLPARIRSQDGAPMRMRIAEGTLALFISLMKLLFLILIFYFVTRGFYCSFRLIVAFHPTVPYPGLAVSCVPGTRVVFYHTHGSYWERHCQHPFTCVL